MRIDWDMTVGFYAAFLFVAIFWYWLNPEIPLEEVVMDLVRLYWGVLGW